MTGASLPLTALPFTHYLEAEVLCCRLRPSMLCTRTTRGPLLTLAIPHALQAASTRLVHADAVLMSARVPLALDVPGHRAAPPFSRAARPAAGVPCSSAFRPQRCEAAGVPSGAACCEVDARGSASLSRMHADESSTLQSVVSRWPVDSWRQCSIRKVEFQNHRSYRDRKNANDCFNLYSLARPFLLHGLNAWP